MAGGHSGSACGSQRAGVECLDEAWRDKSGSYRFRCCVGHEWQRRSRDALVNLLCPRCMSHALALKRMDSLRRLYEAVARRGGLLLLENVYFGLAWHYRFVCR
ncbi:hypothetical protein [Pseudomonas aeruginosa]|uniref:hypothetical protein n=1 Tax=Pseudomonas aeruginosa TaxID=287 RepID=UPI000F52836D|nr:hypothetical protein [Pseudomonas aeruginosa]RQB63945.1 hypothetical protein IPC436_26120 [Pseudomonas aeruginosa]